MSHLIGLDIGGTKIAGGLLSPQGAMLSQRQVPTPKDYADFLDVCRDMALALEREAGTQARVGVGIAGRIDRERGCVSSANLSFLTGKPLLHDLEAKLGRNIRLANDANCAALAEATDGAGASCTSVLGLIMGTGVGAGFVYQGKIMDGFNGVASEIGHLPLPHREEPDGPLAPCSCNQQGCIDKTISGGGLARLYEAMTGKAADAKQIAALSNGGDADALRVLDRFYDVVAKAMVVILHTFDPEIIVVSGGLNALPGLYDEVPKRWGRYCCVAQPKTKFVPARLGATAGLWGAAWLWR